MKKIALIPLLILLIAACNSSEEVAEFTGNEVSMTLIPGIVQGINTTGSLTIKERADGKAQIEIELNGVLSNASHPVHLHYGSLDDNGNVATLLNPIVEANGIGKSVTILNNLENGEQLDFEQLAVFDGSIKIHFEADGPMKDEILGAVNIGPNITENQAYFEGMNSITWCNSEF